MSEFSALILNLLVIFSLLGVALIVIFGGGAAARPRRSRLRTD